MRALLRTRTLWVPRVSASNLESATSTSLAKISSTNGSSCVSPTNMAALVCPAAITRISDRITGMGNCKSFTQIFEPSPPTR
eukprot:scaffold273_cov242-Pinguiococcus_pyrenoidosus.AAC.5